MYSELDNLKQALMLNPDDEGSLEKLLKLAKRKSDPELRIWALCFKGLCWYLIHDYLRSVNHFVELPGDEILRRNPLRSTYYLPQLRASRFLRSGEKEPTNNEEIERLIKTENIQYYNDINLNIHSQERVSILKKIINYGRIKTLVLSFEGAPLLDWGDFEFPRNINLEFRMAGPNKSGIEGTLNQVYPWHKKFINYKFIYVGCL